MNMDVDAFRNAAAGDKRKSRLIGLISSRVLSSVSNPSVSVSVNRLLSPIAPLKAPY